MLPADEHANQGAKQKPKKRTTAKWCQADAECEKKNVTISPVDVILFVFLLLCFNVCANDLTG